MNALEHEISSETIDIQEFIVVMEQRANTYAFLSRMYAKEITQDILMCMHEALYPVSTGNAETDEGNRLLAQYLSNIWENTITELAADYMRIFYGHGYSGHAAAYPFESVYVSEKRLMMQSARDEVLALYRSAGLDKASSWKEGEDHIALELEYLHTLSSRTETALKDLLKCSQEQNTYDELLTQIISLIRSQYNFLKDHIMLWVPLLTNEMRHFSKTDFYVGIANLTDGFLSNDIDLLEDFLDENGLIEQIEEES